MLQELTMTRDTNYYNNKTILNVGRKSHLSSGTGKVLKIKSLRNRPHAADPIKDREVINQIKSYLLSTGRYGYRNWLIFTLGINVGRRCGDLLNLTIGDVYNFSTGEIIKKIQKKEEKTDTCGKNKNGKYITYYIPQEVRNAIKEYIIFTGKTFSSGDEPLFRSQKGGFMECKTFWKILKQTKDQLNLNFNMGTHVMRKSFGYMKYMANKDLDRSGMFSAVEMLQQTFGHVNPKITMNYIGIGDEEMEEFFEKGVL